MENEDKMCKCGHSCEMHDHAMEESGEGEKHSCGAGKCRVNRDGYECTCEVFEDKESVSETMDSETREA